MFGLHFDGPGKDSRETMAKGEPAVSPDGYKSTVTGRQ